MNPNSFRFYCHQFVLTQLVEMVPPVESPRMTGLVEAFLLGVPLPSPRIYDGQMVGDTSVWAAIAAFVKLGVPLSGTQVLTKLEGVTFDKLPGRCKRRFSEVYVQALEIDIRMTEEEVAFVVRTLDPMLK